MAADFSTFKWTADDWGISPGVNAGILELVSLGVVRRVSVMATSEYLETHLNELIASPAELGIHFNLTFGKPMGQGYRWLVDSSGYLRAPARLLALWQLPFVRGKLAHEIQKELTLQLGRLLELKVKVSYFDSHHHSHLLPGLMRALKPTLFQNGIRTVRLPLDPGLNWTAQAPVYWLSLWNRKSFQKLGFHSLPFVYPNLEDLSDAERLKARVGEKQMAEVIVHPAKTMDFEALNISDSYRAGRLVEFQVLKSFAEPLTE